MGDKKANTAPAKKAIKREVKALGAHIRNDQNLKKLCDEKKELDKKKKKTPEDEKKLKELKIDWEKILSGHQKEADRISSNIEKMVKNYKPKDGATLEPWKEDLAPWYRQMIEKEPGLDLSKIGIPGRATGEVSLDKGKEKAVIKLNFKW
jgi:hypothetical protein